MLKGRNRLALTLVGASLLIALPGSAMADRNAVTPTALYVVTGKVTQYIPPSGATIGSISILVKSSNLNAATLRGARLTLGIGPATRLVVGTDGEITEGDRGVVKFRARQRLNRGGLRGLLAIHVTAKGKGGDSKLAGGGQESRSAP